MANVCQKCGVRGFSELLVCCMQCKIYAEHRYCLDTLIPEDSGIEVKLLCEKCSLHGVTLLFFDGKIMSPVITKDVLEQDGATAASSLHDQVKKRFSSSSEGDGNIIVKRKRRRLLLSNEDELEEATPSTSNYHKIPTQDSSTALQSKGCKDLVVVSTETQDIARTRTYNAQPYVEQFFYVPARPISCHIWRGHFRIDDEEYGPLFAHKSSRACEKVSYGASLMTPMLSVEKLKRLDAWPNSFKTSPPTDDNIALYFFPSDARSDVVFDQLLDDMISNDLMLKVTFGDVELLVYTSLLLPEHYHRFDGKLYLWGVFRARQLPVQSTVANQVPLPGPCTVNFNPNLNTLAKPLKVSSIPAKHYSKLNLLTRERQGHSISIAQSSETGTISHSFRATLGRPGVPVPIILPKSGKQNLNHDPIRCQNHRPSQYLYWDQHLLRCCHQFQPHPLFM